MKFLKSHRISNRKYGFLLLSVFPMRSESPPCSPQSRSRPSGMPALNPFQKGCSPYSQPPLSAGSVARTAAPGFSGSPASMSAANTPRRTCRSCWYRWRQSEGFPSRPFITYTAYFHNRLSYGPELVIYRYLERELEHVFTCETILDKLKTINFADI